MPQDILIPAPEGSKYLSEIFNIHTSHGPTLPKNCLFDKVTTGCGGSYVALTSPEPTGPADIKRITNRFRIGNTYTKASIRDYLNKVKGIADSQAADLKEIFEIKDTTLKGSPAYKIVRRL